jgi:hypothetical protein
MKYYDDLPFVNNYQSERKLAMTKTASQITAEEMAVYRATVRQREAQEREVLLLRAQRGRTLAQQAAKLLKKQEGINL